MSDHAASPDRLPVQGLGQRRVTPTQLLALDVGFVVVAALLGQYAPPLQHIKYNGTLAHSIVYALWALASVGFLFRRRYPRMTLVVISLLLFVGLCMRSRAQAWDYQAFVLYTIVLTCKRRTAVIITILLVAENVLGIAIGGGPLISDYIISAIATIVIGFLAGEYMRSVRNYSRAYAELVADRAADAEARRADQITRAVSDERVKLARELHDVVAHGMSVIAVRAGVARMVIETQPDEARNALAIIETASRRTLQEMRLLVSVLRGDDPQQGEREPMPGLQDLPRLMADVEVAGVVTDLVTLGATRVLPPATELSAYRIVQEALTNAVRYAGSTTAHVTLDYRPDELAIEIRDDGPRPGLRPDPVLARQGTGHGLIGIRERAALFGGSLTAGPFGDGYRVAVNLKTADIQDGATP